MHSSNLCKTVLVSSQKLHFWLPPPFPLFVFLTANCFVLFGIAELCKMCRVVPCQSEFRLSLIYSAFGSLFVPYPFVVCLNSFTFLSIACLLNFIKVDETWECKQMLLQLTSRSFKYSRDLSTKQAWCSNLPPKCGIKLCMLIRP